MDRVDEVKNIIKQDVPDHRKESLLQELLVDLKNEMEAQDQNMRPEIRARLAEAYQMANQYLLYKNSHHDAK